MDVQKLTEQTEQKLKNIMGDDYVVKVVHGSRLGAHILVRVYGKNPKNGIWQNCPVAVHLMAHLSDGRGRPIPIGEGSKLSFEQLGHTKINFRKMNSSKGLEDLLSKLLKWFEKAKTDMDAVLRQNTSK